MFLNNHFHDNEEDEFFWDETGPDAAYADDLHHNLSFDDDEEEFSDTFTQKMTFSSQQPSLVLNQGANRSTIIPEKNVASTPTSIAAPSNDLVPNTHSAPQQTLPFEDNSPASSNLPPQSPSVALQKPAELAPLTPQQERSYATHIQVLSSHNKHIVQMTFSSQWMHRIQALYYLKSFVESLAYQQQQLQLQPQNDSAESTLRQKLSVCIDLLDTLLKDKVLKVYLVALEVLESLVSAAESLGSLAARKLFDPILITLIQQLSNKTKKFVKATEASFHFFCAQKAIGVNCVQSRLTTLDTLDTEEQRKMAAVSIVNRLTLLSSLVEQFGIASTEFDVAFEPEPLLKLAMHALKHFTSDQSVRISAAQLVTQVYVKKPKLCTLHLKRLDSATLKFLASHIEKQTNQAYTIDVESIDKQNLLQDFTSEDEEDLKDNIPPEELAHMKSHAKHLGTPGVLNLLSKKWNKRNAVMEDLRDICAHGNIIPVNDSSNVQHFVELSAIALDDNNPKVLITTTKMLRELFCVDVYKINNVNQTFVQDLLRKTVMPIVIAKVGNMNSQVSKHCNKLLIDFSRSEKIGARFVSEFLVEPESDAGALKQWKTVCGKLTVLQKLIEIHQFGAVDGLSMEAVMTYVVAACASPNGQVRQDAVQTIVEVYKRAGNVIQTYLRNQKPALIKELREKVMKEARGSHTNSAPINRLAAIVRPFGFEDQNEELSPVESRSPVKARASSGSASSTTFHTNHSAFGSQTTIGSVKTSGNGEGGPTSQSGTGRKSRFIFS